MSTINNKAWKQPKKYSTSFEVCNTWKLVEIYNTHPTMTNCVKKIIRLSKEHLSKLVVRKTFLKRILLFLRYLKLPIYWGFNEIQIKSDITLNHGGPKKKEIHICHRIRPLKPDIPSEWRHANLDIFDPLPCTYAVWSHATKRLNPLPLFAWRHLWMVLNERKNMLFKEMIFLYIPCNN